MAVSQYEDCMRTRILSLATLIPVVIESVEMAMFQAKCLLVFSWGILTR